jgi:uncharacterized protein (DUF1778 family)
MYIQCAYNIMPISKKNSPGRTERINFRASAGEVRLIRLGAQTRGEKVTQFIVESACSAAEMALADQKHFELSSAQYARFAEALDRPAKIVPALQKLFSEKSAIERNANEASPVSRRIAGD